MSKVFPFSALPTADLVIEAVYEGGTKGNTADDVLGKLISWRRQPRGLPRSRQLGCASPGDPVF
jgi:hypothetical protein